MASEGWICPLCRCGVAPSELRCPCAQSGPVTFGSPYPRMEPPFDWMAAIENVHVGPMVEVVDGEARAIEPNPDETLRFVRPYSSHVELDGCYCYACVEERARKMGLTWFTTAPQTGTPSESSADPANR